MVLCRSSSLKRHVARRDCGRSNDCIMLQAEKRRMDLVVNVEVWESSVHRIGLDERGRKRRIRGYFTFNHSHDRVCRARRRAIGRVSVCGRGLSLPDRRRRKQGLLLQQGIIEGNLGDDGSNQSPKLHQHLWTIMLHQSCQSLLGILNMCLVKATMRTVENDFV